MEKISVLLAVYKPNRTFFRKQLDSINKQTYKNIELIVMDDSDDREEFNQISSIINEHITNIDYKVYANECNIGSNRTFEKLTQIADGDYFAYCDQDDIWEEYKIETLVNEIKKENAVVCYSDLSVIDEDDQQISDSFKKMSKRLNHVYGDKQYSYFLRRNSITGCTMLIHGDIAKQSLPFPKNNEYVHDHWLTLYASCKGRVAYVEKPLIRYRIHSNNQIGAKVLDGIGNKKDYIEKKLYIEKAKIDFVKSSSIGNENSDIEKEIKAFEDFVSTRLAFFQNKNLSNTIAFLKLLKLDPTLILFELLVNISPNLMSNKVIAFSKK